VRFGSRKSATGAQSIDSAAPVAAKASCGGKPAPGQHRALIGSSETKMAPPARAAVRERLPFAVECGALAGAVRRSGLALNTVPPNWRRCRIHKQIDVAGKGTFYRVEAGPLGEAEAKVHLAHSAYAGLGCIVVKP